MPLSESSCLTGIPSAASLLEVANATRVVPIIVEDRIEFGRALILQGYAPLRAVLMAESIPDNDGALQMLARHRLRYSAEDSL